jgi:hypothetical protein
VRDALATHVLVFGVLLVRKGNHWESNQAALRTLRLFLTNGRLLVYEGKSGRIRARAQRTPGIA